MTVRVTWLAVLIGSVAVSAGPGRLSAQDALDSLAIERGVAALDSNAIRAHIRFLADDLLEGRAPGTRGAALAARYVASQFEAAGLDPGAGNGTFYQSIPMVGVASEPSLVVGAGQRTIAPEYLTDFVAWPAGPDSHVTVDADIVFVGYGVTAPEWGWDDFQGANLAGKIVMMLVNDPGLTDPTVFGGPEMTYYGRWSYKLEQAAAAGAVGAILIHSPAAATYDWSVVRNSWSGEQIQLDGTAPRTLRFAAWVTEETARNLVAAAQIDYEALVRRAWRRDFRPIPIDAHAAVDIASSVRRFTADNVIARIPGSTANTTGAENEEAVIFLAHYDHRGVGTPVSGDSIYNGAIDNASGVAGLLTAAAAFAATDHRPRRSLYFVATTAEESGLLGSGALTRTPPVPLARIAAAINMDIANLGGTTRDIVMVGAERSSLGDLALQAAEFEGLTLTPDPSPQTGSFYRSDHFPLARAGVPVLSVVSGQAFIGKPDDWGPSQAAIYLAQRYHRPNDEFRDDFAYGGMLQQLSVMLRLGWWLALGTEFPVWTEGSEFADAARRLADRR